MKSKYNLGNLLVFVGCLIVILSVFVPYISLNFLGIKENISLIYYEKILTSGVIFLVLAALIAVFNAIKNEVASVACAIVLIRFTFKETSNAINLMKEYGSLCSYGAGFYLLLIGTILLLGSTIYALILEKK